MATLALPARPVRLSREEIYRFRYLIAFAVVSASVLELVDTSIVNVAIPHMMGNLGATLDEIAWVSTGYIVANVIILPLTSWLSDRFGRRNYYTGSIILFTISSFLAGNAHTLQELVGARVLQGIGGGALISTAQAILFDVFPLHERGKAMAIFGMGVMVGPTLGPTLGGWITDNYSWPWIFYINLPLGVLAAMMTWRYVPEPEHPNERTDHVDWLGLALLIAGIGALQIMLERGESKNWFDTLEIRVEAVVAAVSILTFIWHELTTEHPVVDLRILGNRQLTAGVVFGLILGFALYASVFALPVFLQAHLGYTAWDTGKVILPGAIASAVTMAITGRITGKMDARYLIVIGVGLFFWAMWLHYHFTLDLGIGDTVFPMILRGTGLGLIFVPLTQVAVADLRPQQLAAGTGLFNLSRQLGGSFGIAVAATLLSRFTAQSREALRAHLNPAEPQVASWLSQVTHRMMTLGGSLAEAQQRAFALLDFTLYQQASVIAFEKVFLVMGSTFVAALPLLLAFRTGHTQGGPQGPAH
ncbi:MAG TPA: DHA2 family efflux MFS transporter permease subunit [Gemmatimonadales bacterium]|nr:DHA2 family efflux MFS transporter permease subunit [Gemmatimonadales bacterium]